MNRNKYLPLSETTYYVMLALRKPSHGYAIMQEIQLLSEGEVRIAAGTLYGALDHLLKGGLIKRVESNDARRKVYVLTPKGQDILILEAMRMQHLTSLLQGVHT